MNIEFGRKPGGLMKGISGTEGAMEATDWIIDVDIWEDLLVTGRASTEKLVHQHFVQSSKSLSTNRSSEELVDAMTKEGKLDFYN